MTRPLRIGPYEIEGELGRGGMGVVWRARDPRLERHVAIKALADGLAGDAELTERLQREARVLAELGHPAVATVYGIEHADGRDYIVMELVDGESLAERLARGPLPLEEALRIVAQVAEGLEAAHDAGVVHRDLKPANIVLTARDAPKVLDFGLAARRERKSDTPRPRVGSDPLTGSGVALGSPGYMSPEQARGKSVDRRSDIFALGCVLYECLSGRRAFGGEDPAQAIAALLEREPDWSALPSATPPRVRDLLARCLAKDPARRQRDAGDVALELRAVLEGHESRTAEPARRASLLPWLAGAAGVAFGAWVWLSDDSARAPAPSPPRTVALDLELPPDTRLGVSDRLMNELAISPDGSTIVVVAEEAGRIAMFARELASGEYRRLDAGLDPRGASFSPDGKWLAFLDDFRALARIQLAGGAVQRIAEVPEPGGSCAWLSDDCIAVAVQDGRQLLEVEVASGATRVVTELTGEFEGFENVAVSPDPEWILADGWKGDKVTDFRVMAVVRASGAVTVLVEDASNPAVVGEDLLIFQRGASLFAQRFDFAARAPLGEAQLVVAGVATDRWGGSSQYAVSPNGTLVYAPGKRRGDGRRPVWIGPDGAREPIAVAPDAFVFGVSLSRDGSRLLLATLRERVQIWVFDLVGGALTEVVSGELFGSTIAPGGDALLYNINLGSSRELRRVPIAGVGVGEATVLCVCELSPTSVSADGRFVLLEKSPGPRTQRDIFVLDMLEDRPRSVRWIASAADEGEAQFSPDEKWVAYTSLRAGRPEVYVRAWPDGQRDWKVSSSTGHSPRWAPDGRTLHYLHEARVLAVDLAFPEQGGETRVVPGAQRIVLEDLALVELTSYGIGPDGRVALIELAPWELADQPLRVIVDWSAALRAALAR